MKYQSFAWIPCFYSGMNATYYYFKNILLTDFPAISFPGYGSDGF
ncbi:hypothetical protein [Leptospira soteropolitanensis]|nr:hypothetical protein [Leptospira soteropolitanensis]